MVKMNFISWKIAIKHNFDWKYEAFFFFFLVGCLYIYNLSNKKMCVYTKKVCMCGGCFDKYISAET